MADGQSELAQWRLHTWPASTCGKALPGVNTGQAFTNFNICHLPDCYLYKSGWQGHMYC